jgi:hypothetical protein
MSESMALPCPRTEWISMVAREIAVKKYVVRLCDEERERLNGLINKGEHSARRLLKAYRATIWVRESGDQDENW